MEVPVKFGQTIEVTITGYGHEGEGVGRYQDFTLFVAGALQGESVRVKITEVKRNFGRGRVLEVVKAVPERVVPTCSVYDTCGGCQLQHLNYQAQLELKRQRVVDAIERIAGFSGVKVHPTLGMAEPSRYRNKVQYPIGLAEGTVIIGFYQQGSHRIVPMQDCLLQSELANAMVVKTRELVEQFQLPIYDEAKQWGLLRHVLIKQAFQTGEVMIVFVTNGHQFPRGLELAKALLAAFPEIKSVIQNINRSQGNVILGHETKVLAGADGIMDEIGGLCFKISARSFFQVNPVQTEVLYNKAIEYAGLSGAETVLDAYCGVGSLSLFLARKAKQVYGIEVVAEAIQDAKANAILNKLDNLEFWAGQVEQVLPHLLEQGVRFEVATVDPPRSGCEAGVLKSLAESGVQRIVYVSCNPSTLARDLKVLNELEYETKEIQPVDMFPQTYHVECVARIERK